MLPFRGQPYVCDEYPALLITTRKRLLPPGQDNDEQHMLHARCVHRYVALTQLSLLRSLYFVTDEPGRFSRLSGVTCSPHHRRIASKITRYPCVLAPLLFRISYKRVRRPHPPECGRVSGASGVAPCPRYDTSNCHLPQPME